MSRIRGVKPELFRHEGLQELGSLAMLVFIGLFTQADRDGRFRWQPRQLKLDILPFVEYDIEETLGALQKGGFVARYQIEGRGYGFITGFHRHQYTTGKEPASKLPAPPSDMYPSMTRTCSVNDEKLSEISGHTGSESESESERESEEESGSEKEKSTVEFSLDGAPPDPSPVKEDLVAPLVEAGWRYFLERTNRHADAYKLTPDRLTMGRRGLESLIAFAKGREHPNPMEAAVKLFHLAVDRLVESPFHSGKNDQGRQYLDWHQLFTGKGYSSPRKLLEFWLEDARWEEQERKAVLQ